MASLPNKEFTSKSYSTVSIITVAFPLSALRILMSLLSLNSFNASSSSVEKLLGGGFARWLVVFKKPQATPGKLSGDPSWGRDLQIGKRCTIGWHRLPRVDLGVRTFLGFVSNYQGIYKTFFCFLVTNLSFYFKLID